MKNEHDTPDYSKDPNGEVIALDSHIRLANPARRKPSPA